MERVKTKILYALVAASVAAGSAMTASALVLTWIPKGRPRQMAERFVIAPGLLIFERLHGNKRLAKLEQAGEARVEAGKEKIVAEAEKLSGRKVAEELNRLPHLYNVGAWATSGFTLCLLMTLAFGISSFKEALALGVKVTVTLVFLHAALVLGGVLAVQKLAGS